MKHACAFLLGFFCGMLALMLYLAWGSDDVQDFEERYQAYRAEKIMENYYQEGK